jgi:hypothetical protein
MAGSWPTPAQAGILKLHFNARNLAGRAYRRIDSAPRQREACLDSAAA